MTALEFFRSPRAVALLERAARAAGMPLSVHYVENNQEGPRVLGWGQCAACAHVNGTNPGRSACRNSRTTSASMALAQERPMPFLCHMGFACIAAPALPGERFLLTFGPYVPAEAAESIESDVRHGLRALAAELDAPLPELPFALDDIHRVPGAAAPALAEWTLEALRALWAEARAEAEAEDAAQEEVADAAPGMPKRQGQRPKPSVQSGVHGVAAIAAALAGANQPQARALLRDRLGEFQTRGKTALAQRRARVIALCAEVLEAAEHAGLATAAAWEAFAEFTHAARAAGEDSALLDAAMGLLGIIRRRAARSKEEGAPARTAYAELNAFLLERLGEEVTLEEAAARLGDTASALSHRLTRKFGMNFSEYIGRLRMDKAKELLRRTKLSATEISRRVGVRDQSHFSKLFKKFEGTTPSAYREQYGRKK